MTGSLLFQHFGDGTIGGLVRARAAACPDHTLLVTRDERYSYQEFSVEVHSIARAFINLGCAKGDRIGILSGNTTRYILSWFGLECAGLIQVPMNPTYKGDLLEYIIEHSGAKMLIIEPDLFASLQTSPKAIAALDCVVFTSDEIPNEVVNLDAARVLGWREFVESGKASDEALPNVRPSDASAIKYTSGTTGKSKGVLTPHLAELVMADESNSAIGITAADVMYTCLPLFHVGSQIYSVMGAINAGATITLGRQFDPGTFWDDVRDFGATSFTIVGSQLFMLLAQAETARDRDHQVRIALAFPAPQHALYRFEKRFGVTLIEGYGQTEIKTILFNPKDSRRPGSIGKPTASSTVAIFDDNGTEVPPGQVGEMVYRPKHPHIMMRGYWNNAEATVGGMKDLWWHTGDLAYRDLDGYFYFVDRRTDALLRNGTNVSSREVEGTLLSHPAILDAAMISVRSAAGNEELMAVVRLRDGAALDWADYFRHCDTQLASDLVPRYYRQVKELPYTANGKIRKVVLRDEGVTNDTWDSVVNGFFPSRPSA
jgi:crotonobetaine/carnitine-CoA ligase